MTSRPRREMLRRASALAAGGVAGYAMSANAAAQTRTPFTVLQTFIPIAGAFLLMQGIVEIIRCVICIKNGHWPSRTADVQEVDVDKLKEMVHVKDEDIAKLDRFVVDQETRR